MKTYKTWDLDTIEVTEVGASVAVDGAGEMVLEKNGALSIYLIHKLPMKFWGFENKRYTVKANGIDFELTANCVFNIFKSNDRDKSKGDYLIVLKVTNLKIEHISKMSLIDKLNKITMHIKNLRCDSCKATIPNGKFTLMLDYDVEDKFLKPFSGEITTRFSLISNSIESKEDLETMSADYNFLMALALRSPTPYVLKQYYSDNELVLEEVNEQSMNYIPVKPLIDYRGMEMPTFLVNSYPKYIVKKKDLGLVTLIEYYWRSHIESTVEIKFLLASVLMESFKFSWAANVSTTYNSIFTKNGLVAGFKLKGAGPKERMASFNTLITEAANSVGYDSTIGNFGFIDDRNCLFHTGLSSAHQNNVSNSYLVIGPELEKLYRQIDDILLRILDFHGDYYPIHTPNRKATM